MKKAIIMSVALAIGICFGAVAQANQETGNVTNGGISSQQAATKKSSKNGDTPAEGLQRRGSGKMAAGASRNGNTNLSPVQPTQTQGSTSQGSASVPSTGGAKGTRVSETRPKNSASTKNGTASDGGLTSSGTPTYGAKVDTKSTSGSTGGSKRPTSTGAVQKEARTSDKNVSTGYPQPTGAGKPGTPSGSASGKKVGGNSYPQTGKTGSNQ